jgi:DNA-binding GntR family transcriptional regulator
MPRSALIPDIRKVEIPEARQSIPHIHAYLRDRILDGTLTPGTKLSQVSLAEQLGISRTPLREVLRMLQEEGLVEIEPNQRTRVTGLDPDELDDIYGSRILSEVLGISLTLGHFDAPAKRTAKEQLRTMRAAARQGDIETWVRVHADFHRSLTSGAGPALQKQLRLLGDRTIRYIRIYQIGEPRSWQTAGDREHADILAALIESRAADAMSGLAHHLARTALHVLANWAPHYEPRAIPHAVAMVDSGAPAALDGIQPAS